MDKIISFWLLYFIMVSSCKSNGQSELIFGNFYLRDTSKAEQILPNLFYLRGVVDKDSVTLILSQNTVSHNYFCGIFYFDKNGVPSIIEGQKSIFMDSNDYSVNIFDCTHEQIEIKSNGIPNRNEISMFSTYFKINGAMDSIGDFQGQLEYKDAQSPTGLIRVQKIKPKVSYKLKPYFSILNKTQCNSLAKLDWSKRYSTKININSFILDSKDSLNAILINQLCDFNSNENRIHQNFIQKCDKEEYDTKISPNNSISTVLSYCGESLVSGVFRATYLDTKKFYNQVIPFLYNIKNNRQLFLLDVLTMDDDLTEKIRNKIHSDYKNDFSSFDKVPIFITPMGITFDAKFKHSSEAEKETFVFIPFKDVKNNLTSNFKNLIKN